MKYSKATSYGLHAMVHLALQPKNQPVGVEQLAERQQLSSSYLSKILTKLVKGDLITSVPGAKGGYSLARAAETISFLEVIEAIEGKGVLFTCTSDHPKQGCLIENTMHEAEASMKNILVTTSIQDIVNKAK